ncbi:hypothetical protein VTK26DRAFT_5827 [Humicola hyalothermophila]
MLVLRSLGLLSLAVLASAQMEGLDNCATVCWNEAMGKVGDWGCAANDWPCICGKGELMTSLDTCGIAQCPAGIAPEIVGKAHSFCATAATLPPGVPVPSEEPSAEPTPEPGPTTEPPAPTSTPEPSSEVPPTSSAESEASVTSSTVETSTTSSSVESTSTAAVGVVTTAASTQTSSASASHAAATSEAPEASPGESGLSQAAKIGIGIGAGAALLALLGVGAFLFFRTRRSKQVPPSMSNRYKISHPMPNQEHAYTYNQNNSEYDIGASSELESKSRRYEDMLPREEPRQMV